MSSVLSIFKPMLAKQYVSSLRRIRFLLHRFQFVIIKLVLRESTRFICGIKISRTKAIDPTRKFVR